MKKIILILSALFTAIGFVNATTCSGAQAGVAGANTLACSGSNDYSGIAGCGSLDYQGGQEALVYFTPAVSGAMTLNYSGQTWSGIYVWDGCPDTATCVGTPVSSSASSKSMTVTVVAGTTYYIMVDTWPTPNSPCPGTLTIIPPTTCPNPSALGDSSITSNSASIFWTTGGATQWIVEYGPVGFLHGTGTILNVTSSADTTLSGLMANTSYDWYVRDYCAPGDSSFWMGSTFTTSANCGDTISGLCYSQTSTIELLTSFTTNNPGEFAAFTFLSGQVETCCDAVRVYDGPNGTGNVIYTSQLGDYSGVGTIVSPTNTISLAINSDVSVTCNSSSYTPFSVVANCISCLPPTAAGDSAVSTTTADLFWTDASASSWEVEYGAAGFSLGSGTSFTVNSSADTSLTGLTSNTAYDWYVRSICGVGDTSVWVKNNFTTSANCGDTLMGLCYSQFNTIEVLASFSTGNPTDYASLTVLAGGTEPCCDPLLIYDGPNATGNLIYGSLFGSGSSDYSTIGTIVSPTNTISIAVNSDGSFTCNDQGYTPFDIVLDCITCLPSSAFGDSAITASSADVFWTSGGASQWQIEYDTAGFTQGTGTVITVNAASDTTLSNLLPETDYDWYVRDICAVGDTSVWVQGTMFTTLALCAPPSSLGDSAITTNSADIYWMPGTATQWEIQYGPSGFSLGSGTFIIVNSNPDTILTGLSPITAYDFYVRGICGAGDTSAWSSAGYFTTLCPVYVPYYTTNFNTFLPQCWDVGQGGSPSSGGPNTIGFSYWEVRNTWNPSGSAVVNLFSTGAEEWLLSPSYDLSGGGVYQVTIETAISDFYDSVADAAGMTGTDDQVQLVYSTDGGATWTTITTWNASNQPDVNGVTESFVLAGVTAPNVQFSIWASEGTVDDNPDYDFHVNSFTVELAPVNDVGVTEILEPSSACGMENTPFTVTVENFGLADQYYVPVVVEVSGDFSEYFSYVIDTLPSLSTTSFTIDSLNTLVGGLANVNAFTAMASDEDNSNDAMMTTVNFGAVPADPMGATFDACFGDSIGLTTASVGELSWYTSDTATTAVYNGNTYNVLADTATTYYVEDHVSLTNVTYTIEFYDDFGDGWVGTTSDGFLDILINGTAAAGSPFTLLNGNTGSATFTISNGDQLQVSYTPANIWAYENAYSIYDQNGNLVFGDSGDFSGTAPTSGVVYDQAVSAVGCSSSGRAMVSLNVLPTYNDTMAVTACDSMMIAGVNQTTSGFYTDSLMSASGCDSIVVYNLTINNSTSGAMSDVFCAGSTYTLPDGSTVSAAGTYVVVLTNAAGCDSLLSVTLNELMPASSTMSATICSNGTYTLPDGMIVTDAGTYTSTLSGAAANGCDSVVTTTVSVVNTFSVSQNVQLCANDTLVVGTSSYTATGTYTDTLMSVAGCDSVVTTNLVVFPASNVSIGGVGTICENAGTIDLSLSPVGGTLSGDGVTGTTFDPSVAGVGTHVLTYTYSDVNGCNASASLEVEVIVCTGIKDINGIETIAIFPNPYSEVVNLQFEDENAGDLNIKLFDITGRLVVSETVQTQTGNNTIALRVPEFAAAGVSIIQIERDGNTYQQTLIKK